MIVYRIGRTRYAKDLDGEGARLFGGRWNHKLTPCIYSSESRALALLEYTANVNIDDIPRALSITAFEIDPAYMLAVPVSALPGDWRNAPAPAATKDFGTDLLRKADYGILKIPSAIMEDEFNYLLNPRFTKAEVYSILSVRDFVYDVRLKL
nr:RES domain-containing protein [uncultured Dyadobacter sp.]